MMMASPMSGTIVRIRRGEHAGQPGDAHARAERRRDEQVDIDAERARECAVLGGGARLILLDEPTDGLTPVIVDAIADLLLESKRAGITELLVEQNVRFAAHVSDRRYLMVHGQIVESLRNDEVREREDALLAHLGV